MTVSEIIKVIKTDKNVRLEITNTLSKFNESGPNTIPDTLSLAAKAYLFQYLGNAYKQLNSITTYSIYHRSYLPWRTPITINFNILEEFSIEELKDIVTPYFYKKLLENKKTEMFNANAPELQLNEFSYTLFENYIKSLKTKLSSNSAISYLKLITNNETYYPYRTTNPLWNKYADLIFTASTKSEKLKTFIQAHMLIDGSEPFNLITRSSISIANTTKISIIEPFIPNTLTSFLSSYNVPISSVKSIDTSIIKKLKFEDALFRIDMLTYLEDFNDKAITPILCKHILAELNADKNVKTTKQLTHSLVEFSNKLTNTIIKIKEENE